MSTDGVKENIAALHKSLMVEGGIDFSDQAFHKDVFNRIRVKIASAPNNSCPPAFVIVYAIRNIMHPMLLVVQMPNLLNLLGHVNVLRKHAVAKITDVLRWNDYCRKHPMPDVSTLSYADEDLLRAATLRADEKQRAYRRIVNTAYKLDLHHQYVRGSLETFWTRLQTYFPGQFSEYADDADAVEAAFRDASRRYTFHWDLSDEERRVSTMTGVECAKFARDVANYLEDSIGYCALLGLPPGLNIDQIFPPPNQSAFIQTIDEYLDDVQSLIATVERLFGTDR